MTFPKLLTERLTLREIKTRDIFGHTELFSDNETMQLFGGSPVTNDLEMKNIIESTITDFQNGNSIFWVITLSDDKEFIGFVRLMSYRSYYFDASYSVMGEIRNSKEFLVHIDKNGWEIDYAMLKNYRKKGIMKESMEAVLAYCKESQLNPVYAKVNSLSNAATINLLQQMGFAEYLPLANSRGELGMIYKWGFDY